MAMTGYTGPVVAYGPLASLQPAVAGAALGGEQLAGPSVFYHGLSVPDPRFLLDKEKAGGFKGVIATQWASPLYMSADAAPAAHSATAITSAATVTSGTTMTLATPSFAAVSNIPIVPTAATTNYVNGGVGTYVNGSPIVTPGLCLDFGFAMGTVVSGSALVTVLDVTQFVPGMPLVIAATSTTTVPWLATVVSINAATATTNPNTLVMSSTAPFSAASFSARIGTGNIWQNNEGTFAAPTAALPYLASGPTLLLDPRQSIGRGVVITCNSASGTGGTFTVRGYDVYGQAMSEAITIAPGTALTKYGNKAFKYITSVTPGFTDATYTYSVGTSDVFGFALRSTEWELLSVYWAGATMTSSTGWTAALATYTASSTTTADVRGTIQTSAFGGGSGIGSTASNGSYNSSTGAFTGNRLYMGQDMAISDIIFATNVSAVTMYGNAQA